MPNAAQAEIWNGATGERWAGSQARITAAFGALTERFLGRLPVQSGHRVLDVGCGAGDLALTLAGRVGPHGHVLGIDLSAPLLAVARRRLAEVTPASAPLEFRQADAAALELGPDRDLIVSRFGVMFFDDPAAAFGQLRRNLKPCGRLAVLCWRGLAENAWARIPLDAVIDLLGNPEAFSPDAPGAFAFANSDRVTGILRQAGFDEITAAPIQADVLMGRDLEEAGLYAATLTPAARTLVDAHEEARAEAVARVTDALRPFQSPEGIRLGAACWIYEARNPG
jgi:SAM-dependent methyltransferase